MGPLTGDGLGQKLPRTTAQNLRQWILKCTWLVPFARAFGSANLTPLSWVAAYCPWLGKVLPDGKWHWEEHRN